jgi:hypothetical protein
MLKSAADCTEARRGLVPTVMLAMPVALMAWMLVGIDVHDRGWGISTTWMRSSVRRKWKIGDSLVRYSTFPYYKGGIGLPPVGRFHVVSYSAPRKLDRWLS